MEISLNLLKQITKLPTPPVSYSIAKEIRIPGIAKPLYLDNEVLHEKEITILDENKVGSVDIRLDRTLLKSLHDIDSVKFRLPTKVLTLEEFITEHHYIEFANNHSQKRRTLISAMEYYLPSGEKIISYNEVISSACLDILKTKLTPKTLIAFRYSEHKVAILVDLALDTNHFREKFKLNSEIVYSLTQDLGSISELGSLSQLSIKEDIIIIDDPTRALESYSNNEVRLLVIGGIHLNEAYRAALVEIKKFDPYARFMLVKEGATGGEFLLNVEINYLRDNWL